MLKTVNEDLWSYLKNINKPIVLYGMGDGADKILNRLNALDIKISGVFASDEFVRHQSFHGFEVCSFDEMKKKFFDFVVLVCFGSSLENVIGNIKKIASACETYAPDVPVCGDGTFDMNFYNINKSRFEAVYDRLADETSKKCFENIINYKLSGKLDFLFDCETSEEELYSLLKLSKESYLDLGAYNGDTVLKLSRLCKDYKKIIAVEPDLKTFKKLCENTAHLKNFEAVNKCIHNESGMVNFEMYSGRNSKISPTGTQTLCTTIDELCKEGVSYIKFDVEGNEYNAVCGGEQTIKKYSPKMLVSCYHRNEDMFLLPEKIISLCPDYKMYMRHNPYVPAWDTNFIFVK